MARTKTHVSKVLAQFVAKPNVADALAAQTGADLGVTMARVAELQAKLEAFLSEADKESKKVSLGEKALAAATDKQKASIAAAADFEAQLGAVQGELAEQMQLYLELAKLAGVSINRRPETPAEKIARISAELAKKGASAKVPTVVTATPGVSAEATSVKLLGVDVDPTDLEARVIKLLEEREAAVRAEVAKAFSEQQAALNELKQKLVRANTTADAQKAELATMRAQQDSDAAKLATLKTQLDDTQAARLDLVNALNELVPMIDSRRATDVQRIRTKYHLK